jgi:hypothetical protein
MLVRSLRDPLWAERLGPAEWTGVITAARAESLLAALAHRLTAIRLPPRVQRIFEDARADAEQAQRPALWEAEMARRALAPLGVPLLLLKGTAYAAAGLPAMRGRSIGDLDILVPRQHLGAVQQALLAHGWEWVKEDRYDDLYYRRWMHELPPLIHQERDRMIDVHHTILPLTARRRPDASALIGDSISLGNGLRILSPPDMIVQAAAHLFADGDLAGGLRNLWDIDRLLREFGKRQGFWRDLDRRARLHQLTGAVSRSLRLAADLYGTPVDESCAGPALLSDALFRRRLCARDGWGRETHGLTRLAFYVRSHLLRMPPLMLARHLWIKTLRGRQRTARPIPASA